MQQATATYDTTDSTVAQAHGSAMTMLMDDLAQVSGVSPTVFSASLSGVQGEYSVTFTLQAESGLAGIDLRKSTVQDTPVPQ
jgi:hypothetical protein